MNEPKRIQRKRIKGFRMPKKENVRRPMGRIFYYVLLTRCARCRCLKELKTEPFKGNVKNARYVVGVARSIIRHPESGKVTHRPGEFILIKDGVMLTVFHCPVHAVLTFVRKLSFSKECEGFEASYQLHHRMPDGKEVKCK